VLFASASRTYADMHAGDRPRLLSQRAQRASAAQRLVIPRNGARLVRLMSCERRRAVEGAGSRSRGRQGRTLDGGPQLCFMLTLVDLSGLGQGVGADVLEAPTIESWHLSQLQPSKSSSSEAGRGRQCYLWPVSTFLGGLSESRTRIFGACRLVMLAALCSYTGHKGRYMYESNTTDPVYQKIAILNRFQAKQLGTD
jgi:hypothetical protein